MVQRISNLRCFSLGLGFVLIPLFISTALAQDVADVASEKEVKIASGTPLVARLEMRLAAGDDVDVIAKGDLLTLIEEREEDYVILTHDGTRGAVDKVNAVQVAESASIYSELIEDYPEEGRFHTLRASAYWALGDVDSAIDDFNEAIELGYDNAQAYTSRGLFYAERGELDKAIADYNIALEKDPDDVPARINRAAAFINKGAFKAAIRDYTDVLEAKPESASVLHQRAIAFKAAGMAEKAVEDFATIMKNNPDDRTAVMGRGYVFFQTGQHEDAIKDFSLAIEMNEEDAVAWNNRGYNYSQLGKYAPALEDYDKAISLAPSYTLAHQNRAWLLATTPDEDLYDPAEAVVSAQRAAELNEHQNVADLAALAAALAADGKFGDAVGWQERVVEMIAEPYQAFAKSNLERYRKKLPFSPVLKEQTENEKEAAAIAEAAAKEEGDSTKTDG